VRAIDPHAVADPQIEIALLFDDQRVARIESHGDPVSRCLSVFLLDLVSDERTAECAGNGGRRVSAAATDLVTDHATRDSAYDGSAIEDRLVIGGTIELDSFDFPFLGAGRGFGHREGACGCKDQAYGHPESESSNVVSQHVHPFVMLYRVDQPDDCRSEASERGFAVASIGLFSSVRTFVATLGWFCFDALRRKFANVLRMSVLALFL
jgi:hypothetical protein